MVEEENWGQRKKRKYQTSAQIITKNTYTEKRYLEM